MKNRSGALERRKKWGRVALVVVGIVFIFLIVGLARQMARHDDLSQQITDLDKELKQLNLDKKDFLQSLDAYQSDFFAEQEARTKFNLKKPGEKVVIIPVSSLEPGVTARSGDLARADFSSRLGFNMRMWWEYFFGEKNLLKN